MLDELLAEAERKDTVFRADFNQEQRRSFEPFGLGQFMPQIIQIATSIEETKITLEEGHGQVMQIMESYYERPYPLK